MSSPTAVRDRLDPIALPPIPGADQIGGNLSPLLKQQCLNTFTYYAIGEDHCFAYSVGSKSKIVSIDVETIKEGEAKDAQGLMQATLVIEVEVDKNMVNGTGTLHGGCVAYLLDSAGSASLVAIGLATKKNGVGVTSALNIIYHAPALVGQTLKITSISKAFSGRVMHSRAEIVDKKKGRQVASAFISKMQPTAKL